MVMRLPVDSNHPSKRQTHLGRERDSDRELDSDREPFSEPEASSDPAGSSQSKPKYPPHWYLPWLSPREIPADSKIPPHWYIEDGDTVPVSYMHRARANRIEGLLEGYKVRTNWDALIGQDQAQAWDSADARISVDPDVYVLVPPPPEGTKLVRNRIWEPGHYPPKLAVEIVSPSKPGKDYDDAPLRHEILGTEELWVFDPDLYGRGRDIPKPVLLQVFLRQGQQLVRQHTGSGPAFSRVLNAWVFVTEDGHIELSDDIARKHVWLTKEEMAEEKAKKAQKLAKKVQKLADEERIAKELAIKKVDEERIAKELAIKKADEERIAKEQALARLAELEAMMAARSGR